MKCQRCLCGEEEATCRVRSDVIDMKVCAACADEARRLGLAVEVLGSGGKDNEEKKELELIDYRSGLLTYCGQCGSPGSRRNSLSESA